MEYQEDWNVYLKALYYDHQGDWDKSHELVQDLGSIEAAWIHGYLHRKEGDDWNANYWYSRAGKPFPKVSLAEEWKLLWEAFQV